MQRVLTTVTLLGLLVATAAAFAITEHLKLIKSPIAGTQVSKVISPVCRCADSKALIQIRLRHADHVTVTILDSNLHKVATVASRESVPRGTPHQFFWDGRTAAGTNAPDGVYRPEVHLVGARHTFLLPNRILLDTTTPKVLSASGGDGVLFPGSGRSLAIRYAFSEPANAVVYLGKRQIIRGRPTREHANVKWAGKVEGSPVAAGTYVLSVGARDAAGNETPAAERKSVRVVVRYIDLAPKLLSVRPGALFAVHVQTKAPRYTWRLGARHGAKQKKVLRLHAPSNRGTYRLFVTEQGHTAIALVRVRSK
ncbi:MAG TPA: FlgD immunoglobulin-like domain containing protein [Gaiellaceae bacterium]|nr:FlgD immunoglobulin-like domain containing protein [Gaiellaceae bacterium]